MTGLDKIVSQILEEANNSASAKLEKARAEAEEIMNTARAEAEKEAEEILQKAKTDMENYAERTKSAADLRRRTAILAAKQEMISQVLDKAYQKFCSMDEETYFATLLDILKKFVMEDDGVIFFSEEDRAKLPDDYEEKIEAIAAEKGGTLTVSQENRNIERGFVLAYGGIEENCSFRALFDSRKDDLQDKVQAVLFM
ncbi:MAG TPA: hypothetical protein IAA45_12120 [Candidatus Blautia gallistercoris]|uniref:V-type proton ATPase subunit E n=1 Tax=Candidatus Blautia gallistercoris TaxID=2838490 RepID=A0A9D2B456_9FIRM|nr:hypothetical protein [Candidatus Blautia gallistercoris]